MSRVIKLMKTRGRIVIFYRTNVAIIAALSADRLSFDIFMRLTFFDNDDDDPTRFIL